MSSNPQPLFEFGPFQLDPAERVLLKKGEPVAIPPKDFETLLVLVHSRGHIVERKVLLEAVWPGTFVEEGNLSRHISSLRELLGDKANGKRFIETVPKRGYRFVALVREVPPGNVESTSTIPAPAQLVADTLPQPLAEVQPRHFSWRVYALFSMVAVLALGIGYGFWLRLHSSAAPRRVMLAVLPVQNLSGNPENEYITDGLTEELITQLGNLNPQQLSVIARTSSMTYKSTSERIDQIGRELGVDYLLEASFRGDFQKFRVTTQLIRVRDQSHIWARSYDRDVRDVLQMETAVAEAVASEIQVHLAPASRVIHGNLQPLNPEAYLLTMRGRQAWAMRTGEGLHKSVEYFDQAIARDPNYAPAYAGRANSLNVMLFYGYSSGQELINESMRAARKAVELDDSLPDAHVAVAYGEFLWKWNWETSEAEFQRALQLDDNYATAHHWYALFLASMGRRKQSIAEIQHAQKLDPLSPIVNTAAGYVYYFARDFDRSAEECRKVLLTHPDFYVAHAVLGMDLNAKGMHLQAIEEFRTAIADQGADSMAYLGYLGNAYAQLGKNDELHQVLVQMGDAHNNFLASAMIYAGIGDRNQALSWLERGAVVDAPSRVWINVDPVFDPLRREPRFQALIRQMNLPQ